MAEEKKVSNDTGNDLELGHTVSEGFGEGVVVTPINVTVNTVATAGYHRKLTKRQIMMMTFGAGIGTGLWVGTGQALKAGMVSKTPFTFSRILTTSSWTRRDCYCIYSSIVRVLPYLFLCNERVLIWAKFHRVELIHVYRRNDHV